eukprot:XP_001708903.1 Hypothetical protein GL50803_10887 [Giardia lamblia ATCC 50803]
MDYEIPGLKGAERGANPEQAVEANLSHGDFFVCCSNSET